MSFHILCKGCLEHPLLQNESCIICMDNVSWHHHELVKDVMDAAAVRHRIVRIPSYSPQLNPIEICIQCVEGSHQTSRPDNRHAPAAEQIEDAAALITDTLISRCLDHVNRLLSALHTRRAAGEVRSTAAGCGAS